MTMLLGDSVRAELRPAAALFRSLGDPVRLTILRGLVDGEARVVDLTARLGLAQATVSAPAALAELQFPGQRSCSPTARSGPRQPTVTDGDQHRLGGCRRNLLCSDLVERARGNHPTSHERASRTLRQPRGRDRRATW
jgi:hypothetical protein